MNKTDKQQNRTLMQSNAGAEECLAFVVVNVDVMTEVECSVVTVAPFFAFRKS